METQHAVEAFFKKGKLLTPEALRYLENKNIDTFLPDNHETIVDIEDLLATEDKIRILKNITSRKSEVTTSDIIKFYNSKYEKMKSIILSRMQKNFVSVNKLDATRQEAFVIGIVRDIRDNDGKMNVEFEDSTGAITAIFEQKETEDLELDDVVAIQGTSAGKVMTGQKILYPDMPLRQPTSGKGKACFISCLHLDEAPKKDFETFLKWFEGQDIRYLFVSGGIGDVNVFDSLVDSYCKNKKVFAAAGREDNEAPHVPDDFKSKNIIPLSNPSLVEINGVKILLAHKFEIRMLRKRHMENIKPVLTEDAMALEELPDIVCCGSSHQASTSNYKSTTIANSGSLLTEFRPVVIDLATRDVVQVSMDMMQG